METFSRLVRDPAIKDGKLVVKGTDILVSTIEKKIGSLTTKRILELYPELTWDDIDAIIEYQKVKKQTLFSCVNLTKKYNRNIALNKLTYSTKSQTLGLFGPNGSGKSTFLKLLLGMHNPTDGEIDVNIPKNGIRVIPDFPRLPDKMTVDEWIISLERIYGLPLMNVDFQEEFKLEGEWIIKSLSAGQYRLAAILPMFFGMPQLIILDEPTNFLDAYIRDKVLTLMKKQVELSKSKLIIASHRIEEINLFAKRVMMLHDGELIADVDMDDDIELKYSVLVSNFDEFKEHLDRRKVNYEVEDTHQGKTVVLPITSPVWTSLKQYLEGGNIIYSINKIDKLQAKLKEVI